MAYRTPGRPGRPRVRVITSPLTASTDAAARTAISRELAPVVALPTWQALRRVLMWAEEAPGQRGDLFEPGAMAEWEVELLEANWEPDVRLPLAVLVGELANGETAIPQNVARACMCVTEWALGQEAVATGLVFAEAAALAWSKSARYAWAAGRLLHTHGRIVAAERWLTHASHTAAGENDPESQVLAINSWRRRRWGGCRCAGIPRGRSYRS